MTDGPATVDGGVLTPALAQEIAGETSAIIGLNVIITDAAGIVLGSGDESRVGTFHEASLGVVAHQRTESHDAEQASRLRGVLPGTTLPIVHQDRVVGTVGITGSPDQVIRFGQVVKRQTEILLEEAVLLRTRMTRERVLESLLRDVLTYDPEDPADVAARARDFGFDLRLPRRAIVLEVVGARRAGAGSAPLRLVRETFHNLQDISGSLSPTRHVVLHRQPQPEAPVDREQLVRLAEQVRRAAGGECLVGIGGPASSEPEIRQSYAEALTAIRLGPTTPAVEAPYDIDRLRAEQLVLAVPGRTRARIVDSTLGDLRRGADWPAVRDTIVAWVESGFVLVAAAEALQIHRNTLVYRLGRIAERTGLATTERRRWLALYVACLADGVGG